MKEYKVITAKTPEDAEAEMNKQAKDGWEVKTVTFWETAMAYRLVITFERTVLKPLTERKGALLYMAPAMYEVRPTGFASLRSEQGASPLSPLRGYPHPRPKPNTMIRPLCCEQ